MGVYAIALATSGIIQIVATFGVASYVIREPQLVPKTLDSAFTINAVLSGIFSVVLIVAGLTSKYTLGDSSAGYVLFVLALGPVISALAFRPSTMLQREMRFKQIALISVAASVAGTITSVSLAILGFSYMSLAFGTLMPSIVSTASYIVVAPHHLSFRFSTSEWRKITRFGVQIMSINGVAVFSTRLAEVVIGRVLGLAALGQYARAGNLSNMIFENVYGTMTRVIFVQLAKEYRETGQLQRGFVRGLQAVIALMWPLLIGVAILSGPMIKLLYGERWVAAATLCLLD